MRINELRRSSAVIPKQSAARQLVEFGEKNGTEGYFVSFTKLEKLGIYPQTEYFTPLGIYAYPLEYVVDEIKDSPKYRKGEYPHLSNVVPFAGNSPFLTIFKCDGNVVDLQRTGKLRELIAMMQTKFNVPEELPDAYNQHPVPWKFWSSTLYLANGRKPTPQTNSPKDLDAQRDVDGNALDGTYTYRDIPTRWNAFFRSIGIDGISDSAGYGVIHPNEPIQAVFFSLSKLEVVARITNTQEGSSAKVKKHGSGNSKTHYQVHGSQSISKIKRELLDLFVKAAKRQASQANKRKSNFKLYLSTFTFDSPEFWDSVEVDLLGDKFLEKTIRAIDQSPDGFEGFVRELIMNLRLSAENVELLCKRMIGVRVVKPAEDLRFKLDNTEDADTWTELKAKFNEIDFEKEVEEQLKELKVAAAGRFANSISRTVEDFKLNA